MLLNRFCFQLQQKVACFQCCAWEATTHQPVWGKCQLCNDGQQRYVNMKGHYWDGREIGRLQPSKGAQCDVEWQMKWQTVIDRCISSPFTAACLLLRLWPIDWLHYIVVTGTSFAVCISRCRKDSHCYVTAKGRILMNMCKWHLGLKVC